MQRQTATIIGACIGITIGSIILGGAYRDATYLNYAIGAWMVFLTFWITNKFCK